LKLQKDPGCISVTTPAVSVRINECRGPAADIDDGSIDRKVRLFNERE
jgi:hypothetical protein